MGELADVLLPELLAGEVIAHEPRGAEAGDDALAVGHRRRGTVWVAFAVGRLLVLVFGIALPEQPAIAAVEAEHAAHLALVGRLRQEDALAPDDRRRVAGSS